MGLGGSKQPKVTAQEKAILDLKIQRDRLKKYQKHIQAVIDREQEIAKKHLHNGDKKRALLVLKKKRYQMQLMDQADEQLLNVDQLVGSIEFAVVEQRVFEGLKKGNEALKKLNDQMRIEDVEKLMEDTEDAIAYQKEIDSLLGNNLSVESDEQVQQELDELLKQEAAAVELPSVPTTKLPAQETTANVVSTPQEQTSTKQKQLVEA